MAGQGADRLLRQGAEVEGGLQRPEQYRLSPLSTSEPCVSVEVLEKNKILEAVMLPTQWHRMGNELAEKPVSELSMSCY